MMNRYEPSAYGRNDFPGGDFGLFGGYSTAAMAPPPAGPVPAPFSAGPPPPPSLMSLTAPPPVVPHAAAPVPMSQPSMLPPVMPPPGGAHLHSGMPSSVGMGGVTAGAAGMTISGVNTNSKHPLAVKARVFVGNLNTNIVTRDEFEQLFRRFGEVTAVSLHRGYGFVQFAFEHEARNAVSFTDGMVLAGQRLDVNLASEPKVGREVKPNKRQADTSVSETSSKRAKSSSDGKSQASSIAPKPLFPSTKSSLAKVEVTSTPAKTTPAKAVATKSASANIAIVTKKTSAVKTVSTAPKAESNGSDTKNAPCSAAPGTTVSTADILICGQCRALFDSIQAFTAHRKENPKKCSVMPSAATAKNAATATPPTPTKPTIVKAEGEPESLLCFICQKSFDMSWNLIAHVSKEHNITIYHVTKTDVVDKADKTDGTPTKDKPASVKSCDAAEEPKSEPKVEPKETEDTEDGEGEKTEES